MTEPSASVNIGVISGIILGAGAIIAGAVKWIDNRTKVEVDKATATVKEVLMKEIDMLRTHIGEQDDRINAQGTRIQALENGQRESKIHLRVARDEAVRIDNAVILKAVTEAEEKLHA